jgi:hypothetical protein
MELDTSLQNEYESREDVDIDNVWNTTNRKSQINGYWYSVLDKNCDLHVGLEEVDDTCENFLVCQHKYKELIGILKDFMKEDYKKTIHNMSLAMVLYSGLFVGFVIGMCGMYLICSVKEKCSSFSDRNNRERQMRREFRERNNLINFVSLGDVPRRNDPSPAIPNNRRYQEIVHYTNTENTRQFLERLFGRRQPRYLRNNSQMIPNQIQVTRLSNSNGNSSRVRVMQNVNSDQEQLISPETSRASSHSALAELITADVQESVIQDRPALRESYTPPPPYKDCVVSLSSLKDN